MGAAYGAASCCHGRSLHQLLLAAPLQAVRVLQKQQQQGQGRGQAALGCRRHQLGHHCPPPPPLGWQAGPTQSLCHPAALALPPAAAAAAHPKAWPPAAAASLTAVPYSAPADAPAAAPRCLQPHQPELLRLFRRLLAHAARCPVLPQSSPLRAAASAAVVLPAPVLQLPCRLLPPRLLLLRPLRPLSAESRLPLQLLVPPSARRVRLG